MAPKCMGSAPTRDPFLELGVARCLETVQKRIGDPGKAKADPVTKCWVSLTNKTDSGYCSLKLYTNEQIANGKTGHNREKNWLLHRISWAAANKRPAKATDGSQLYISHLCANRECFNPDHLTDEPHDQNLARKGCLGSIVCGKCLRVLYRQCVHGDLYGVACKRVIVTEECCLDSLAAEPPADPDVLSLEVVATNPLGEAGADELLRASQIEPGLPSSTPDARDSDEDSDLSDEEEGLDLDPVSQNDMQVAERRLWALSSSVPPVEATKRVPDHRRSRPPSLSEDDRPPRRSKRRLGQHPSQLPSDLGGPSSVDSGDRTQNTHLESDFIVPDSDDR